MQGSQDHGRLGFLADEEIESWYRAAEQGVGSRASDGARRRCRGRCRCRCRCRCCRARYCGCGRRRSGVENRSLIRSQSQRVTGEKELNAELKLVGEVDFGDRGIDRDLQLWLVHLAQCRCNNPVVALIGVDQERVVDEVRSDPDVLQQWRSTRAGAISFVQLTEISPVGAALRSAESGTEARAEAAAG